MGISEIGTHRITSKDVNSATIDRGAKKTVSHATVLHANKIFSIDLQADETVLEACLRQGLAIPHNCKRGQCGACIGRSLAGKVIMHKDVHASNAMPSESIAQGGFLACSSKISDEPTVIAFDPWIKASLFKKEKNPRAINSEKEYVFDLFSSLIYGWLIISLIFPILMELVLLPLFTLVLMVDSVIVRTCLGGGLVLVALILAPLIHLAEAYIFRLPKRTELLGGIPITSSLKAPLLYFPAAIALWFCIEIAIHLSSGVYTTPSIMEMFIYLSVIQLSNLLIMDLLFWIVHGPYGLHHPTVFGRFHSKHHRQRITSFSTGPDLAPIDMIAEVSIFTCVPIACGFLLGFDSLSFVLCSLINTIMISTWAHSPYEITKIMPQVSVTQYLVYLFPWIQSNPHQVHHAKVECNYSIWGFWDKIFGTYQTMSKDDIALTQALHKSALDKGDLTALTYPKGSPVLLVELIISFLFCGLLWFVAETLDFHPNINVVSSLLSL